MARDLLAYLNTETPDNTDNPSTSSSRDLFDYLDTTNTPDNPDTPVISEGVRPVSANLYRYDPSRYDRGGIQPYELNNLEAIRESNQTVLDALGRSTLNLIGKTGVNVAGGILGSIYGLGSAIANGEVSKIWDNSLTTSLDAASEAVGDYFKVYKSADYEDKSLLGKMFTHPIQFTDEFMDTLSFTTGAIVTEYLSAGMASGLVSARALKYLKGLDKAADASSVARNLSGGNMLSKVGNAGTLARQLSTGAAWEASVEARQGAIELKDKMYADALEEFGVQDVEQLPPEVVDEIENNASNAGLFTFLTNMALVGGSNMMQFPKVFGASYNTSKRAENTLGRIARENGQYIDTFLPTTRSGTITRNIATALKNPFMEGIVEEGGQSVLSNTANMYWDRSNDADSKDNVSRFIHSLATSLKDTYTTGEGWYEIGMGMLIGSLGAPGRGLIPGQSGVDPETGRRRELWTGGIAGSFQERHTQDEQIRELVNGLNESPNLVKTMQAHYDFLVKSDSLQKQQDRALSNNDIFAFNNFRDDQLHAYIDARIKAGMTGDLRDSVEDLRRMSADDFYTAFRGEELSLSTSDAVKNQFKLNSINELEQRIDNTVEASEIVDGSYNGDNEDIRTELIYNIASAKNIDIREQAINRSLLDLTSGAIGGVIPDVGVGTVNVSDYIKDLKEGLKDTEISEAEKASLNSTINLLQKVSNKKISLTAGEFQTISNFIISNPVEANLNLDTVLGLFEDSKKLKQRRESLISLYNTLFTEQGQQQFEDYQDKLNKAREKEIQDREEAAQREEENKQVKKNKQKVKKEVEAAKVKKNEVAKETTTDKSKIPVVSDEPIKTIEEVEAERAEELAMVNDELNAQLQAGVNIPQEEIDEVINSINDRYDKLAATATEATTESPDSLLNLSQSELGEYFFNKFPEQFASIDQAKEGVGFENLLAAGEQLGLTEEELSALRGYDITPEKEAIAELVNNEEVGAEKNILKDDGAVFNDPEADEKKEVVKFIDNTLRRTVGNTINSLNVEYTETYSKTGDVVSRSISSNTDEEGNLVINPNFDSRLQDPDQFKKGDVLTIRPATYEEMVAKGVDNYTREQFDKDNQSIESFVIGMYDSNNTLIGYLPTQENIKNRVVIEMRDEALSENIEARERIFNNPTQEFKTKIVSKSTGAPLFSYNNKSLYDALGDGNSIAPGVKVAVYKEGSLKVGLNTTNTDKIKLPAGITKDEYFREGSVYSIIPTGEKDTYLATNLDISRVTPDAANTIVRMLQLFRARTDYAGDSSLINERNRLSNEIDFSNIEELMNAINSIIYTNNSDDRFMFDINLKAGTISLGLGKSKTFKLDDIKNNSEVASDVAELLTNRFYTVRLANFGRAFNQPKLVDGQLQIVRHRNYNDYLNAEEILKSNLQSEPIEGTNKRYFTAQSVIGISRPFTGDENSSESTGSTTPESTPTSPDTRSRSRRKSRLKPQVDSDTDSGDISEDFNDISDIDSTIEQEAQNLLNKCTK